ncbi:hypothetical protein KFE25_010546 [Diacronema lutheri]|uniref:Uncharacterized protein n=1 Tax=Diacronema lutheri TaxID=2081491 RepID=A0A8J5XIN6_DIALT|nr:hypothetical protein KFE25_010546 [Diacronema lutheri]
MAGGVPDAGGTHTPPAEPTALRGALPASAARPAPRGAGARLAELERELAAAKAAAAAASASSARREAELVGLSFALRDALLALQQPAATRGSTSSAARFGLVEVLGRVPPRAALAIWPELDWGGDDADSDCASDDGGARARASLPADLDERNGALLVRHRGRMHLMKEAAMLHSPSAAEHARAAARHGASRDAARYSVPAGASAPWAGAPAAWPIVGADILEPMAGGALDGARRDAAARACPVLDAQPLAEARKAIGALRMTPRAAISAIDTCAAAAGACTRAGGGSAPLATAAMAHTRADFSSGGWEMSGVCGSSTSNGASAPHGVGATSRGHAGTRGAAASPRPTPPAAAHFLAPARRLGTRSVAEERAGPDAWRAPHSPRALETALILRQAELLASKHMPAYATRDGQRDEREARGVAAAAAAARRARAAGARAPPPATPRALAASAPRAVEMSPPQQRLSAAREPIVAEPPGLADDTAGGVHVRAHTPPDASALSLRVPSAGLVEREGSSADGASSPCAHDAVPAVRSAPPDGALSPSAAGVEAATLARTAPGEALRPRAGGAPRPPSAELGGNAG